MADDDLRAVREAVRARLHLVLPHDGSERDHARDLNADCNSLARWIVDDVRAALASPAATEPGLRARGVPLVENPDGRAEIDRATRRAPYPDAAATEPGLDVERLRRQNHENAVMRDRENSDLRSRVAKYEHLMAEARQRVRNWPVDWTNDPPSQEPDGWWRYQSINHVHEVAALIEYARAASEATWMEGPRMTDDLRAALRRACHDLHAALWGGVAAQHSTNPDGTGAGDCYKCDRLADALEASPHWAALASPAATEPGPDREAMRWALDATFPTILGSAPSDYVDLLLGNYAARQGQEARE